LLSKVRDSLDPRWSFAPPVASCSCLRNSSPRGVFCLPRQHRGRSRLLLVFFFSASCPTSPFITVFCPPSATPSESNFLTSVSHPPSLFQFFSNLRLESEWGGRVPQCMAVDFAKALFPAPSPFISLRPVDFFLLRFPDEIFPLAAPESPFSARLRRCLPYPLGDSDGRPLLPSPSTPHRAPFAFWSFRSCGPRSLRRPPSRGGPALASSRPKR